MTSYLGRVRAVATSQGRKGGRKVARRVVELERRRSEGVAVEAELAALEGLLIGMREGCLCEGCGYPLTDPESVRRRIGPVCWSKGRRRID